MKRFFSTFCVSMAFMAVNANVPTQPEPKKSVESVITAGASFDNDFVIFVPMIIESPTIVLDAPIVYGDFIVDNVDMVYIEASWKPPSLIVAKQGKLPLNLNYQLNRLKPDRLLIRPWGNTLNFGKS